MYRKYTLMGTHLTRMGTNHTLMGTKKATPKDGSHNYEQEKLI